jgi:hypothetical protein
MLFDRVRRGLRSLLSPGPGGPPALDEAIRLPCHALYVHWGFLEPVEALEWDVTVRVDPGTSVGEYLALFDGSIDGAHCYLGLQTDVEHPDLGRGVGKGLIFSTWWSFDESDTCLAPGGFRQLGTHEGRFVGVRRPYVWSTGDYRVTLSRGDADEAASRPMDWFYLSIQPLDPAAPGERGTPRGPEERIGGLRFPRRIPGRPARVDPGGLTFLEVYSRAPTWADVAPWHVELMAWGNGLRCPSGRGELPRWPHGQQMPNASVRWDAPAERVELRFGAGVDGPRSPLRWP